ncbi:MAG TPA: tyrosine--tRNA ligase [Myxococcaceae bacterium]|nr:tyrosine--tRNA ligase [Myxococcaceae bacterium]
MSPADLGSATPDEQYQEVTRGSVDLHSPEELRAKLKRSYDTGKPLLVKTGFDPSRPDLHLGHSLLLTRMRRFQQFGHEVVFLIGDFTGMIGDPSGKNVTRPALSREEIAANAETYREQVDKILDPQATRVRFNSEWLEPLGAEGLVRLSSRYPLARMLEREDFKKRFREGRSIAIHELLYPLLQGYDSVALKADVELGSTDQLFNLLIGRHLMKEYGLEPQVIMTGPILEGLDARAVDGKIVGEKMSKSLDNYVGISEPADQIYGKLMSISDELMWRYYELLSSLPLKALQALRAAVEKGEAHPKDAKSAFAREIAARFCGEDAAEKAAADFDRRFARKEIRAEELPLIEVPLGGETRIFLSQAIARAKLASSSTEARRLIAQGGVKLNQEKVSDPRTQIGPGDYLLQVGKLRAARVRVN